MNDLRPILFDDPTDEEKLLIGSARLDVAPRAGKGRVLAALGITAAVTTAAAVGGVAAPGPASTALALKWLVVGVAGGALLIGVAKGGALLEHHAAGEHAVSQVISLTPPRLAATHDAPSSLAPSGGENWAPSVPEVAVAQLPRASASSSDPVTARDVRAVPRPSGSGDLAAQVAALAEARRVFAAGDAAASLERLDAYEHRFEHPALASEATLLRIEVLVALGRRDEARALAKAMLASDPGSPYAQRVASLVGSPGAANVP